MIDIRTHLETKKGWWIDERICIPNALPKDGLIVVFRREDAEAWFDASYEHKGKGDTKVWYFNETYDREIAEIDAEGRICANPSVIVYMID